MQARIFASDEYHAIESDLCRMHKVPEEYDGIDDEWSQAKFRFAEAIGDEFSHDPPPADYEFPHWHNNIRMLWIYLYADGVFTPRLPEAITYALASFGDAWFAQLECETDETMIGWCMFHKGLFLIRESDAWPDYLKRMGVDIVEPP